METAWSILGLAVAMCPWVAIWAYRAGRRIAGRKTMPWRPIFQLVDHRTRCLDHDPARVRDDLGSIVPLSPVAWAELSATRRPVATARVRSHAVAGAQ